MSEEKRVGKLEQLSNANLYHISLNEPVAGQLAEFTEVEAVFDSYLISGIKENADGTATYLLGVGNDLKPVLSTEEYAKARKRFAEFKSTKG